MTFDRRITAFSTRFLSDRSFELIVAPALADFQYDAAARGLRRATGYLAVLRALAGGIRQDLRHESATFVGLALLPVLYYAFLIVLWADFFAMSTGLLLVAALVVLSFGPVLACYWPERPTAPRAD
jgi:hypothetical protein